MASYHNYPHLCSPVMVNGVLLRNRLISTASTPHHIQGPEEYPTDRMIEYFGNIAKGGAAVVTVGAARPSGRTPATVRLPYFTYQEPRFQNNFCLLTDTIHRYGAKASFTMTCPERPGYDVCDGAKSMVVFGSERREQIGKEMPKEMIGQVIEEQAQNCALLKNLGFDMIYLHASYLFFMQSRFLSPLTNRRTDEYGGDLEHRAKFLLDMCRRIKEVCGKEFLIECSISAQEPEGGNTVEDAIAFAHLAEGLVDILQLRGPEIDAHAALCFMEEKTPWMHLTEQVKASNPRMLIEGISGFTDPDLMEWALKDGKCDIIGSARSWITNPDFMTKVYEGRREDIIPCLRCHRCHSNTAGQPFLTQCSANPRYGISAYMETPSPAERVKKIAVIGGGPAGMKAAVCCAERGHQVTLYEKESRLGGMLNHAEHVPFAWCLTDFRDYLIGQVSRHGIDLRLCTEARPDTLREEAYDELIVAIGARPRIPEIPGVSGDNVFPAADVFGNEKALGDRIVIVGGGEVGMELGLHLARLGKRAFVLSSGILAKNAPRIHFRTVLERTWKAEHNLTGFEYVRCTEISGDGVSYTDSEGAAHFLSADSVVLASGYEAQREKAMEYFGIAGRTHVIGDCETVGTVLTAQRSAYSLASIL